MNKSNRIISIDFLKLISIFGVVFIHARNGNIIPEIISELFRVAVPLFIIFFAYFLEKSLSNVSTKKEYYNILKQKFFLLFLPYAFFTILYFFVLNDLSIIKPKELITGYWSGYGWSGQYFFIILFQLILIFPLLQKLANVKLIYVAIISLFLYIVISYIFWDLSIINKLSDRIFIYWIPYAILGVLLFRNINLFRKISNKIFLLSIIFIPIEFFIFKYLGIFHSPYVLVSVLISSSLIAIYFIVNEDIIKEYLPNYLKKLSIYISNKTLGIFVLNPLFIFLLKPFFSFIQVENVFIDSIMIFLFSIIISILCILTVEILSKTFLRKVIIN
jgi:surface polysaccharide O-acyltransferase-like enzyme